MDIHSWFFPGYSCAAKSAKSYNLGRNKTAKVAICVLRECCRIAIRMSALAAVPCVCQADRGLWLKPWWQQLHPAARPPESSDKGYILIKLSRGCKHAQRVLFECTQRPKRSAACTISVRMHQDHQVCRDFSLSEVGGLSGRGSKQQACLVTDLRYHLCHLWGHFSFKSRGNTFPEGTEKTSSPHRFSNLLVTKS